MSTVAAAAEDQLAHTVADTDVGQAAFTLFPLTRETGDPTFKVAALGYTVMVEASVHTQLAVLTPVKLRMEEQVNWFTSPALLVAEMKVTMMALPALLNAAEASSGTDGTIMPAASVACTVGLAVGFTVGALVGSALGVSVGRTDGAAVGPVEGDAVGFVVEVTVGTALGCVEGDADGVSVGATEGLTVGVTVGSAEGATLGAALGSTVGATVGAVLGTALGTVVGS